MAISAGDPSGSRVNQAATCAAAIVLPAAFAFYEYHRLEDVRRISVRGIGDGQPDTTTTASTSPAQASASTVVDSVPRTLSSATTFLIIAVDSNEPEGILGSRTDTIMLLTIDPDREQMRMLSIPRDLWVSAPGSNSYNRINSFASTGNPAELVATIEALFDVSIDHLVEVDFIGFKALTDLAGGVSLISDAPLRDTHTGLDLPGGQCVTLAGEQALALVRSRHTEYFDGSRWMTDPRSDFGRIARQQIFLRALTGGLFDELDDPGSIDDFVSAAIKSLVVDAGLDAREMVSTAWTIHGIGLAGLRTATVQASGAVVGGAAVLQASDQQIADAANFLRDDVPSGAPITSSTGASSPTDSPGSASAPTAVPSIPDLRPCTR